MRYFSEETVKKIITDTVNATLHIVKPSEDYPYIELPDNYGRLIDADELEKAVKKMVICDSYEYTIAHDMIKGLLEIAPTILEATK